MAHRPSTSSGRRALAAAAGTALTTASLLLFSLTARWVGPAALGGPADPGTWLLLVVCVVGVGLAGWTGLGVAICALGTAPGLLGARVRRLARWSPPVARRVAALLLGSAVGGGLAPAATAAPAPSVPPTAPAASASRGLPAPAFLPAGPARPTPGPLPDPGFSAAAAPGRSPADPAARIAAALPEPGWAPAGPPRAARPRADLGVLAPGWHAARVPVLERVVVRRGDSLWTIAARHLGPGATAAQVAREWPRWHAANRQVIGEDPALLVPGQQLEPPSPDRGSS